jgi:hypothetical protein
MLRPGCPAYGAQGCPERNFCAMLCIGGHHLSPFLRGLPYSADGAGTSSDDPALLQTTFAPGQHPTHMPQGIPIADVLVMNPVSLHALLSAAEAAMQQDQQELSAYTRGGLNPFFPFSMETHRHLSQPAMKLLQSLGDKPPALVASCGCRLFAGTLRELRMGLCWESFLLYRASVGMPARVGGEGFQAEMRVLAEEHVGYRVIVCCASESMAVYTLIAWFVFVSIFSLSALMFCKQRRGENKQGKRYSKTSHKGTPLKTPLKPQSKPRGHQSDQSQQHQSHCAVGTTAHTVAAATCTVAHPPSASLL